MKFAGVGRVEGVLEAMREAAKKLQLKCLGTLNSFQGLFIYNIGGLAYRIGKSASVILIMKEMTI